MARKLEFLIDTSCNRIELGKAKIAIPVPYAVHAYLGRTSVINIELGLASKGWTLADLHDVARSFVADAQKAFPKRKTGIEVSYLSQAASGISMDHEREHPYIEFEISAERYSLRIERH